MNLRRLKTIDFEAEWAQDQCHLLSHSSWVNSERQGASRRWNLREIQRYNRPLARCRSHSRWHWTQALRSAANDFQRFAGLAPIPLSCPPNVDGIRRALSAHNKTRRSGFTLLETILAVALTALLLGLVAAGLRLYTQVVAGNRDAVTHAQTARAALQMISTDLRAAFYEEPSEEEETLTDELPSGEEDTEADLGETDTSTTEFGTSEASTDLTFSSVTSIAGVYGNETELRIDIRGAYTHPVRYDSLVEAGSDPLVDNLVSVDRVVTYYVRPSDPGELAGTPLETASASSLNSQSLVLVRRVQKRAEAEYDSAMGGTDAMRGEQLLSDQVVNLQFSYHDGTDWTTSWDSEQMGGLPIAVQITITAGDPADDEAVITSDNTFQVTVAIPTAASSSTSTSELP